MNIKSELKITIGEKMGNKRDRERRTK